MTPTGPFQDLHLHFGATPHLSTRELCRHVVPLRPLHPHFGANPHTGQLPGANPVALTLANAYTPSAPLISPFASAARSVLLEDRRPLRHVEPSVFDRDMKVDGGPARPLEDLVNLPLESSPLHKPFLLLLLALLLLALVDVQICHR